MARLFLLCLLGLVISAVAAAQKRAPALATPIPTGTPYVRQPYGVRSHEFAGIPAVVDAPTRPFGWFRSPRTIIGVFGGPEQALVAPEGGLETDFGTLVLFTGVHERLMNQRVKTLKGGWLPVVEATFPGSGARYEVEYFAANIPGVARLPYTILFGQKQRLTAPVNNMISFVKYSVTNTERVPRTYRLTLGLTGTHIEKGKLQAFASPSLPRRLHFDTGMNALVANGKLAFTVSERPARIVADPSQRLQFELRVLPGATRSIIAKVPYFVGRSTDAGPIQRADYATYLTKTSAFWRKMLARGTQISLAEPKVLNTYRASVALLLLDSLHVVAGRYFTHANFDIYDSFFIRDMAFNMKALLDAGYPELARKSILDQLPYYQKPNGMFQSQAQEYDGNGEALWMMGQYFDRTRDATFARRVFPMIRRSMAWQWHFRRRHWADSGGLFPKLIMPDDEEVEGHIVGYDLFAIAGARGAAAIACGLRERAFCGLWKARADQYARVLRRRLKPAFNALGVVPPTIEGLRAKGLVNGWYGDHYGIDWGNLEIVYPSGVFQPYDRMVGASLHNWRTKTFEGEFTYPADGDQNLLHSYTPLSILETYIRRNDDRDALQDLYSALVHTSATDMTSEGMTATERWGWAPNTRTMPHDEFADKYISALRDIMAFELNGDLYLVNALSPKWLHNRRTVAFSGQTDFGPVAFSARRSANTLFLDITPPPNMRSNIVVHVPRNDEVVAIRGYAKTRFDVAHHSVILESAKHSLIHLRLVLSKMYAAPDLDYSRAVNDYEENYRKMWSPPRLSLHEFHVSAGSARQIVASATLKNTGGAGYVAEPIALLIDGKVAASRPAQVGRGIGFTSPASIVSFERQDEGVIALTLSAENESPGTHQVTMRMGDRASLPSVTVTVP